MKVPVYCIILSNEKRGVETHLQRPILGDLV